MNPSSNLPAVTDDDILDALNATVSDQPSPLADGELDLASRITGRADTLRNTILSFVAEGKYESALRELHFYQKAKGEISSYESATRQIFDHCDELIEMTKKILTAQDVSALPMSKRHEIYSSVTRLFDNLKSALNRLEHIENDLLVRDIKSTVWVIRSISISIFAVLAITAFAEGVANLDRSIDILTMDVSNFIFGLIGL